jgi:hypothetical protein
MRRRFNYTGRRKILHSEVRIGLSRDAGGAPTFEASFDLSRLELPPTAMIFVEAYHQTQVMRFPYGTVQHPVTPADRRLVDLDEGEGIHFRIKVCDPSNLSLLLAEAKEISPLDADEALENRISLLSLAASSTLGQEVWRLHLPDGKPILYYNDQLPNGKNFVTSHPAFHSLVFPCIMRLVLTHILIHEGYEPEEEELPGWMTDWLRFAQRYPGVEPPPTDRGTDADEGPLLEWIERAVSAFTNHDRCLERLQHHLEERQP